MDWVPPAAELGSNGDGTGFHQLWNGIYEKRGHRGDVLS